MGVIQEASLVVVLVGLLCVPIASCRELWTRQTNTVDGECTPTPARFQGSFLTTCNQLLNNNGTCGRAWDAFSSAFAGRDPSDVTREDYSDYFDVLPIEAGPSQSLFWSGVQELVTMVDCMCSEGATIVSSENTPSSRILSSMGRDTRWCGTTDNSTSGSADGIEYTNPCLCEVTTAFWAQFSTEFAMAASGTTFYLAYGERSGGTFALSSFFARYELPNLSPPTVTEVVIINVHRRGVGESCGQGTLVTLQNMITERNLTYSCYDVYGNLNDAAQVQALSKCASSIIAAEQKGSQPKEDDCSGADPVLPLRFAVVMLAIIMLLSLM